MSIKSIAQIMTIPHEQQPYATTGDWIVRHGEVVVWVSRMPDKRYELLVGIHELVEAALCENAGIDEERVTAFDVAYERARDDGDIAPCGCKPTATSEPGDDVHAPYHRQHNVASAVELLLAKELGVSWDDYEAANLALYRKATTDENAP